MTKLESLIKEFQGAGFNIVCHIRHWNIKDRYYGDCRIIFNGDIIFKRFITEQKSIEDIYHFQELWYKEFYDFLLLKDIKKEL